VVCVVPKAKPVFCSGFTVTRYRSPIRNAILSIGHDDSSTQVSDIDLFLYMVTVPVGPTKPRVTT
jgi:hypothetical protein